MELRLKRAREIKRRRLIRRLFTGIVEETVGKELSARVEFSIRKNSKQSTCRHYTSGRIKVILSLASREKKIKYGYTDFYYEGRAEKLNRYILNNRHDELRFVLYHEARHAQQRLTGVRNEMSRRIAELDADDWALKHLGVTIQ